MFLRWRATILSFVALSLVVLVTIALEVLQTFYYIYYKFQDIMTENVEKYISNIY